MTQPATAVAIRPAAGRIAGRRRVLVHDEGTVLGDALAAKLSDAGLVPVAALAGRRVEMLDRLRTDRVDVALLPVLDMRPTSLAPLPVLRRLGVPLVVLSAVDDPLATLDLVEKGAWAVIATDEPAERMVDALGAAGTSHPRWSARRSEQIAAGSRARAERRASHAPFDRLTPREREILLGLTLGRTAEQLAAEHTVALATVRTYIRGILETLGVRTQLAAVALAFRSGWAR